jgi:hypothetical protein
MASAVKVKSGFALAYLDLDRRLKNEMSYQEKLRKLQIAMLELEQILGSSGDVGSSRSRAGALRQERRNPSDLSKSSTRAGCRSGQSSGPGRKSEAAIISGASTVPRRRDYLAALDDMFAQTSTAVAPWYVVPAEYKWYARIAVATTAVKIIAKGITVRPPALDPEVIRAAKEILSQQESRCSVCHRQSARRD